MVIGGGIIGCTAAALLAEAGRDVTLVEATALAAGASGRNSGTVQHPFDPVLLRLHLATLTIYQSLAVAEGDFAFPAEPAGVLLLTDALSAAEARATELATEYPELEPAVWDPAALHAAEPSLAPGWSAVRLSTGYPVVPDAATRAMAARAMVAGAQLRIGVTGHLLVEGREVTGVSLEDAPLLRADQVLVAAGPWTPVVFGELPAPPITRTWGVTVQVRLESPPGSILEEGVVHTINVPEGAADSLFSMVTVNGTATVGSTFMTDEPTPDELAPRLLERAAAFVPAVARAPVLAIRMCARPQSADGRPFIGPVAGVGGLFVCAGHGPWGMSTGPASAGLVVDQMLGREGRVPPELRAGRPV